MTDIVLASPVRTPIGRFGGALASLTAAELGGFAARASLERAGLDPKAVGYTVFGNARQAGGGPNPARQVGRRAGLPDSAPAFTINMACASGLQAIVSAAGVIRDGEADVVLAGGAESMSRVPYMLERARWGYRLGDGELIDGMYRDGFLCPLCGRIMGETAETLAEQYSIARAEQDEFAATSQQKCEAARKAGRFVDEIVPVRRRTGARRCASTPTSTRATASPRRRSPSWRRCSRRTARCTRATPRASPTAPPRCW